MKLVFERSRFPRDLTPHRRNVDEYLQYEMEFPKKLHSIQYYYVLYVRTVCSVGHVYYSTVLVLGHSTVRHL
jgi:hypothetical protein